MARHKIRGKVWEVVTVPSCSLPKDDGECDPPSKRGKQIRIAKRCEGLRRLIVLLHEGIHAGLWDIDEDAVEQLAEDLGQMIWVEMGF